MVLFTMKEMFSLMFIFAFVCLRSGDIARKMRQDWCQWACCLCFLLGVFWFQVLDSSFSSVLSWFLYMMWENSFFVCVPDFHSSYWRDCPFSLVCSLFLCHKSIIHLCVDFFWALNSVPLVMYDSFFWSSSVQFQIGKGVCQGCMLSSCLSNLYAECIMTSLLNSTVLPTPLPQTSSKSQSLLSRIT